MKIRQQLCGRHGLALILLHLKHYKTERNINKKLNGLKLIGYSLKTRSLNTKSTRKYGERGKGKRRRFPRSLLCVQGA